MRFFSVLLLLPVILAAPCQPAVAQAPAATSPARPAAPQASPAALEHLATVLRDPARRAELLRLIEALAVVERALPPAASGIPTGSPTGSPPAAVVPGAVSPGPVSPSPVSPGSVVPDAATPADAASPGTEPVDSQALFTPTTLGGRLLVDLGERIQVVSDVVLSTVHSMADLPALGAGIAALWRDRAQQQRLGDALVHLVGIGFASLLLEALLARLLRPMARRLSRLAPPDGNVWTWLRRVPLAFARLGLDLLPMLLMAGSVLLLLGLVRPWFTSQLVVLMAMNLYLAARLALALARMVLSPGFTHLRLLPISDAIAAWLIIWLRRMLLVGLSAYAMAEIAVLVYMPERVHGALIRLGLLILTLMLVRMIRQQRLPVAALLRPPPINPEEGTDGTRRLLRALRARLAASWHLLAVAWLVVGWVVATVGVERGISHMLRGTVLSLGLVAAAKLLDEGMRWLLRRLLHPAAGALDDRRGEASRRAPWLDRLSRQYVPPFRVVWSFTLVAVTVVLLAHSWGYQTLDWFTAGRPGYKLIGTVLSIGFTALLGLAVWESANSAIEHHLTNRLPAAHKVQSGVRLRTLLPVLRAFLATGVIAFVLFNVLQELGVNIGPLIAGAGVIGLAIGFGAQKLVQDVITGIFLLIEDSVAVGDVVALGDRTGVVEHLTIRSIKLRAMDGSVHWVPFSAVSTVTNMTRDYGCAVVDVTVTFNENPDRVIATLRQIADGMQVDPAWKDRLVGEIATDGLEKMTDLGMVFRLRARTAPSDRWMVARELNRRCLVELQKAGVELLAQTPRVNVEAPPTPAVAITAAA